MPPTSFALLRTEGRARRGRLVTARGVVETPQFMPVATQGSVRAQRTESLAPAGATMLLANTWHLAQRPGLDVLRQFGGLGAMMGWSGPLLTDSGGFQVFSLDARVDEDGVDVQQPGSGKRLRLTPESSIAAQQAIGADIAMVLDECVGADAPVERVAAAMERTTRWARRCLAVRGDTALFAIVQGGCVPDLRRASADALTALPFDGYALGGLAVGESKAAREDTTELTAELLPADRPRYLMGVGTPLDLLEAVARGVDLFDCVLPTALAQRGRVYTSVGRVDLRRGIYRMQAGPLDPACGCEVCAQSSRAWLHHLFAAREPLAWTLLGLHNLHFWLQTMADIRSALDAGRFGALYAERREVLDRPEAPVTAPVAKARRRPPSELGRWVLHHAPAFGDAPPFVSVRDRASGEVMHAVTAPALEAQRLYVSQPGLDRADRDLVVWDVGLGAGANAMAVIRAWTGPHRLRLVSFEQDLDALRLALANHDHFPYLRHAGPPALLADGRWERGPILWELRHGDARHRWEEEPPPDVILYDPFSFQVDGPMWTGPTFRALRARCARTRLYTYTNSTAARLALLWAGFYVGPGVSTGPKAATTAASTHPDIPLFGAEFLEKWGRSSKRVPDWAGEGFVEEIRAHPQWSVG